MKNKEAVVKNCYPNWGEFGYLSLAGTGIVIRRAVWDWKEAYLPWSENQLDSSLQALRQPFLLLHVLFFPLHHGQISKLLLFLSWSSSTNQEKFIEPCSQDLSPATSSAQLWTQDIIFCLGH